MGTIRGFTLIEVVIVMVITGIIASMAAAVYRLGFTSYSMAVSNTALSTQATIAMARITKELQKAVSFSVINSTQVTFTTLAGTTISYKWSSPTLTRTGITAQTVNNQITSFALNYYQSSFAATTTLTAVQAVTVSMTLTSSLETISLINTVFLDNM